MSYRVLDRDGHYTQPGPKRILALDGGGLRGILTLGMLAHIETLLKKRHDDDPGFRLCHYFDLIAGTSTGAIIAAALAQGMTVAEITGHYNALGKQVFRKSLFRKGLVRALYGKRELVAKLKEVFGASTCMGSDRLRTGLVIVTKRLDTGSTWPISNHPRGRYFAAHPDSGVIPNADYPLWQVVRASTAAPRFFAGESINILRRSGRKTVSGTFVDGGVSPFNNPALQAFMYATLKGYRIEWPTGAGRLLLISLGTGARDPAIRPSVIEAGNALKALVSLMDDCGALVETLLQWMSQSPGDCPLRLLDRELGMLEGDLLCGAPLLTYVRYNVELSRQGVQEQLGFALPSEQLESLTEMDTPENMPVLQAIGDRAGERLVREGHFPAGFDLQ